MKAQGEKVRGVSLAGKRWTTRTQYKDFQCQKANRDYIPTNVLNFELEKQLDPVHIA